MPRQRLSTWLVTLNAGLLLVAVLGLTLVAARLLRQFGDEQALARVAQAGRSAQVAVERAGEALAADAQLLAERPTLARLLDAEDWPALTDFVTQFQMTSRLDGAAVTRAGQLVAAGGVAVDWLAVVPGEAATLLVVDGRLTLVASVALAAPHNGRVLAALSLGPVFTADLSRELGLAVDFYPLAAAPSALAELQSQALAQGQPVADRLDAADVYAAVVPIGAPGGSVAGVAEVTLPVAATAAALEQVIQSLLLLAVGVGGVAVIVNVALGRRLGRPLLALTAAADRIGYGDLNTPVPRATGAEIGALAGALEEMRRRLLDLTADLRRQQSESAAILGGIVEGVYTVDHERRIQYLNPQAARLLGQAPETIVGRFCGEVLRPQWRDGRRPCDDQCPILHARARTGARATELLSLPEGDRTIVVASAPPTEDGRPTGRQQVVVIRDETEIEATRRLRDAVLANISHEFKTPLAAQLASIELLLDQLPDLSTDQIAGLVVSLQSGTVRLTQLIDNLLESVRIEAGQAQLTRRPVALDEVVEHAVELVRPLLDQRGQTLTVDLPYPLPPVCGDAPRLAQVFVNLLANASKYAPPGSPVRIGGLTTVASVTLWVEDEGPGLPAMPPSALFARFVRAADSETGGVGLGLWIVKSIVERHDGQVSAGNTGRGARLSVTLPRMASDEDSDR